MLLPVRDELADACERLAEESRQRGGRKAYHLMAAAYCCDLARVWASLRKACAPGAAVCFVVGDSAPYGVRLPTERWLGELALAAGFKSWRLEKTRDRNVRWALERKHSVPLREGCLWVAG